MHNTINYMKFLVRQKETHKSNEMSSEIYLKEFTTHLLQKLLYLQQGKRIRISYGF